MFRHLYWLVLALCMTVPAWAQEKSYYQMMLDDRIKLSQRPGTADMLKRYLKPVASGCDTVTALFLIPTACPRCEATIEPAINLLKAVRPQERVILVVAHEDAEAACAYLDRQQIHGGVRMYDTDFTFDRIFSTTMGGLQGLLIARIDCRNGRMLTGGELSFVSKRFFEDFYAVREPLPLNVYDEGVEAYKLHSQTESDSFLLPAGGAECIRYETHELLAPGFYPAQIRNYPVLQGKSLAFVDEMYEGGLLYQQNGGKAFRLVGLLQADSVRRDAFIDLPPQLYEENKPYFRYMPLDVIFQPSGGLVMSYSLPEVRADTVDNELNVGFWNAPAFLYRDPQGEWNEPHVCMFKDTEPWALQHYRIFPLREGYVATTCHKYVWPLGREQFEKGNPLTDPFVDAFYDQPNTYAVEVELATGRIVRRFGQLEDVFRRTRTGYWFTTLVADTDGESFIYGNQVSGLLYLTDARSPHQTLRTYCVFDHPVSPQADSTLFYKEEYLQTFAPYFSMAIEQVSLNRRYITCLVRHGLPGHNDLRNDRFELVQLSRKSGRVVNRFQVRPAADEDRLLAYGLTTGEARPRPFYLSKRKGHYYLTYVEKE